MAKKTLADMKLEDSVFYMHKNSFTVREDVFCGIERTSANNIKINIKPYTNIHRDKSEMTSWLFEYDDYTYWFNEADALKESLKRLKGQNKEFIERQEKLKQDTKNHMNAVMQVQQRLIEVDLEQ